MPSFLPPRGGVLRFTQAQAVLRFLRSVGAQAGRGGCLSLNHQFPSFNDVHAALGLAESTPAEIVDGGILILNFEF